MKLDRNVNRDGSGKYALIKLREVAKFKENPDWAREAEEIKEALILLDRRGIIHWGNEGIGENFFVMKYKDRFTAQGLTGYADSVFQHIRTSNMSAAELISLKEYADQIYQEAESARRLGDRIPD